MKAKEFMSVMRKLIREEVRAAIREELRESYRPSSLVNSTRKPQTAKFNTGNSMLDEVLSETIVPKGFGSEGPSVSYEEASFTTSNLEHFGESTFNEDSYMPSTDNSLPFMKNYSALLKKADQISSGR